MLDTNTLMDLMFSAEGLPHFNLLDMSPLPEDIRVGIYLNSSRQIALYFRLKRLLKVSNFPQKMKLYLIRDRLNESLFLEQPFLGDKVITLLSEEYEKINLWSRGTRNNPIFDRYDADNYTLPLEIYIFEICRNLF